MKMGRGCIQNRKTFSYFHISGARLQCLELPVPWIEESGGEGRRGGAAVVHDVCTVYVEQRMRSCSVYVSGCMRTYVCVCTRMYVYVCVR